MPIYNLDNEIYNIPDDVVEQFEKDNPEAKIQYSAGGDDYDIPVSEKKGFLEVFPDATYRGLESKEPAQQPSVTEQQQPQEYPQPTDAQGNVLTHNGQPYSQEVLRRYYSPDNKPGQFKDLSQIAGELQGDGYAHSAQEENEQFDKEMRRLRSNADWRNQDIDLGIDTNGQPVMAKTGDVYDELYKTFDNAVANAQPGGQSAYAQARLKAEQMGIGDMNILTNLLGRVNRQYAKDQAKLVADAIMQKMPERSTDLMSDLQSVYYDRELQNLLMGTAQAMGNDYQDYVNKFLKPQLIEAMKQKYGGTDNDWQGVLGLFSNWQHVGDRLESDDAQRLMSQHFGTDIDNAINNAYFRAKEVEDKYLQEASQIGDISTGGMASFANALLAKKRSNLERDPEKIQKEFEDALFGPTGEGGSGSGMSTDKLLEVAKDEIWKDEALKAEIAARAKEKDMTPEDYTKKYVVPQLVNSIRNRFELAFIEKEMPKSTLEYIMRGLTDDNIIAMIANRFTMTEGQQRYRNMADAAASKGRSIWAEGARLATGMAADFWLWGGWGKLGAKASGKLLSQRIAARAAADHITYDAAARLIEEEGKQYLGKGVVEGMFRHIPQSAITMAGAEATTEAVRSFRDRENLKDAISNTIGAGLSGAATGTAFGVTGGAAGRLTSQLQGVKRLAGKLAGFGVEAGTMYSAEELQKMAQGDEAFGNPFEGLLDSAIKLGFIKASAQPVESAARFIEAVRHPVEATRRAMKGEAPMLNEDDVRAIEKSASGKKLMDALTDMRPARSTDEGEREGYIFPEQAERGAEAYRDFMSDPDQPWERKQKVAHLLGGVLPPPGHEVATEIVDTDKGAVLRTRDLFGNLIREIRYDSAEDAKKAADEMTGDLFNNTTSAIEEQVTKNDLFVRVKDNLEKEYQAIAEKYGNSEDGNLGEKLTEREKNILYMHQHLDELMDIYQKIDNGESLDVDGEKLANTFMQFFDRFMRDDGTIKAFRREFETEYGYLQGEIDHILSKKEDERTQADKQILASYQDAMRRHIGKEAIEDLGEEQPASEAGGEPSVSQNGTGKGESSQTEGEPQEISGLGEEISGTYQQESGPSSETDITSRRDAAYDKGMSVIDNPAILPGISYDSQLSKARVMQQFANSNALTKNNVNRIIEAIDAGDDATAERLLGLESSMTPAQIEAIEQYRDSVEAQRGVDDSIIQQTEDFEDEQSEWLQNVSDANGNVSVLQLDDGRTLYYKSGNLENRYGGVMAVDQYGKSEQVPVSSIQSVQDLGSADDILANNVEQFYNNLQARYAALAGGSAFTEGQQVDMVMSGQQFKATYSRNDAFGNPIFQMEDGSEMMMRPEEAQKAIEDANALKIQQQLSAEAETAKANEQNASFTSFIKGFDKGKPDLTAPETNAAVAVEYLNTRFGADGKDPERARKQQVADLQNGKEQLKQRQNDIRQELARLDQWLAGNEDIASPEEVQRANEDIIRLNAEAEDIAGRIAKSGEIVQLLMTHEERAKFEQERRKEITKARTGYTPQLPEKNLTTSKEYVTFEDGKPNFGLTSVNNANSYLLSHFDDSIEAEKYINEQRIALRNKQRDDLQVKINDLTHLLQDYTSGLTELTPEELQDAAHKLMDLEAEQTELSKQAVNLRKIAEGIKDLYDKKTDMSSRQDELAKAVSREDKLRIARKVYGNDPYALSIINDQEPRDVEEYISQMLPLRVFNWEGKEVGEHHVIGLQEALFGKGQGSRGFGKDRTGSAFNTYLAPKGEGKGFDEVVHYLYEDSPEVNGEKRWDDTEIRDALLDMLLSTEKPSDISHMIINNRIAEAEEYTRQQEEMEAEMAEQARLEEMQEWADTYHLTPEEREAFEEFMKEPPLAVEQEIINQIIAENEEEQNRRSQELDQVNTGGEVQGNGRSGQTEVQRQSASGEDTGNTQQPRFSGAEAVTGMPSVSGDNVSGGTSGVEDNSFPARLAKAKQETNTTPTEAQKKAGNYKMGHIDFGGYRMSIENPKGSVRSGVDKNGKPWSIEMKDSYGYIGKKYGTDGDHLDFFINDDADLDNWKGRVFIVDQKNDDGTFDEHKVMYGYKNWSEARKAYERNYEPGFWDSHVMQMMGVMKPDFDKWLDDSDHKRKPFADYWRTKNSDTVSDPADQLVADIAEREKVAKDKEKAENILKEPTTPENVAKKLSAAYQLKNKDALRDVVEDIRELIVKDNSFELDDDFDPDKAEDYDGNDPEKLAQQYVVRLMRHYFTDYDDDIPYIVTGIKSPKNRPTVPDAIRYDIEDLLVSDYKVIKRPGDLAALKDSSVAARNILPKLMSMSDKNLDRTLEALKGFEDSSAYAAIEMEIERRKNERDASEKVMDEVAKRKGSASMKPTWNEDEISGMDDERLMQLRSKAKKDAATSRYLLATTSIVPGGQKEKTLLKNILQAETDIAALDKELRNRTNNMIDLQIEEEAYRSDMPEDVNRRATGAILKAFDNAGVPYKKVSQKEADQMLEAFNLANQQSIVANAIKNRTNDMARWAVVNVRDPFGVPKYFETKKYADDYKVWGNRFGGLFKTLDLEYPEDIKGHRKDLKKADEMTNRVDFLFDDGYELQDYTPVFYSNAMKAIESIKQEKATPEQWLKMIEKQGGLKAGEDKWLGLSDWLKEKQKSGKKSITKQEIEDYIRQNQIQVAEQHYREYADVDNNPNMLKFRREFDELLTKYIQEQQALNDEANAFNDEMFEKYGEGWANDADRLSEEDQKRNDEYADQWQSFGEEDPLDLAFREMVNNHGDDFGMAFEVNYGNGTLDPQMDMYGEDISDAAKDILQFEEQPINGVRIGYTTQGLDNKKEIALVVPTVEPYNAGDQIHFGDAGGGRAVAWIRFGDTVVGDPELKENLKNADQAFYGWLDKMSEKYQTNPDEPGDAEAKMTDEEKAEGKALRLASLDAEQAYEESKKRVLVIDEIQSKRHQDAREKGYTSEAKALMDARQDAFKAKRDYEISLIKKYGTDWPGEASKEEVDRYNELLNIWNEATDKSRSIKSSVPDAPFEKNWHELAMKRMLRYAAENGYDKVAWTTGGQQAERYNIGHVIDEIGCSIKWEDGKTRYDLYPKNGDSSISLFVKDGKVINSAEESLIGKDLSEVVGKDVAEKMSAMKPEETLTNEDLLVGGEGMKGFYDQILPRFMDKYGKKWGVKTGEINLSDLEPAAQKMWSVDVTPEMRESVMQGQPMFQKGRGGKIYGWTDGKQIYLTPQGMNPNSPMHEYTHIWDMYVQKNDPKLWKEMVDTFKKTNMWQQVRENPNYRSIWDDDNRMASEVHSRLSGVRSEEEFAKAAADPSNKDAESIIKQVKDVLSKFWEKIASLFGYGKNRLDEFVLMPLRDVLNGFNPISGTKDKNFTEAMVNQMVEKTLMGVHNISEDKLKKAIKQGGLANPSMAVFDTNKYNHTDYGEISLIPTSSLIDSRTGRNAGTYSGDAWTPTYPNVSKFMTKKGDQHRMEIARQFADGDPELERHLGNVINEWVEGDGDRMHWLFLKQKGLDPEIKPEHTSHSHEEFEEIQKIFGDGTKTLPSHGRTPEQDKALLDLMTRGYEEKVREQAKMVPDEDKRNKAIKAMLDSKFGGLVDDQGNLFFAPADSYVYEVWRDEQKRNNPKPDWYATDNEASYRVAKEGLAEEYEKWKQDLLGDEDIEEKLFAGWTPDGDKRYVSNTLENASRLMNKEPDTNAYGNGGINASKAGLLKNLKTLSEIRKYRHLLKSGEEIKDRHKEMEDKWFDIIQQVSDMQKVDDNRFININIAEARLQDAMQQRDPIGYMNKEYGYDIDKNSELASEWMNFMEEAKQIPVKYFETKFKRPVRLNEFAIAVVPTTTSPEVVKALEDAGLEVKTYERGSIGDENDQNRIQAIKEAVTGRNDILFQIEGGMAGEPRVKSLMEGSLFSDADFMPEKAPEEQPANIEKNTETEHTLDQQKQELRDLGYDLTHLKLRNLEPGETCQVERRYTEYGVFSFTGKNRVESIQDVAYIFKELENAAVENTFVVFIKDKVPTIIHMAIGSYTQSAVDFRTTMIAYKEINPDQVYFIHNHPSGNLKCSRDDQNCMKVARGFFGTKLMSGIIIDTKSGKFGVFDEGMQTTDLNMPKDQDQTVPMKVYSFSKQVFDKDWNPETAFDCGSAFRVAQFVSSHRLGEHKKMSLLVMTQNFKVTGNIFLPWTRLKDAMTEEGAEMIARYMNQMGGTLVSLYGNYNYLPSEKSKAGKFKDLLRKKGVTLLDIVHIDAEKDITDSGQVLIYSSYHERGVFEPAEDNNVASAGEIKMKPKFQKMPDKQIEDLYPDNPSVGDSINMSDRVLNLSPRELVENYKRLNSQMMDENGLDIDQQEEKFRKQYLLENGVQGLGKASADWLQKMADKYTYRNMALRWDLLDRIKELGLESYLDGNDLPEQDTAKFVRMYRTITPAIRTANDKFNKELDSLSDKSILLLGNPSANMLAAGMENKPMKMYGSKLISKLKKHGFEAKDVRDLPLATHNPIAIFRGNQPDSFAILTTLRINGKNVLVTLRSGEGNDIDFNVISSTYPKDAYKVVSWINLNKGLYYDKEKALEFLRLSAPIAVTTDSKANEPAFSADSAAKIIKNFENPKLSAEKLQELYPEFVRKADDTADLLGGSKVIFESEAPEEGNLGWYDPNDNSVHVVLPEQESAEEVQRTVCHEKLGHEGLVALTGSQAEVDKFGQFIFDNASKDIRKRIIEKAEENDPGWEDNLRYSHAAQEVFADIAADGPRSEDEFSLWTKVKHYLINLFKKMGIRVRGLLNDHDMRYYVLKTGEALKRWNNMSQVSQDETAKQYKPMYSRRGKPRKRKDESMAQYLQRLRDWERWKIAEEQAAANNDPMPEAEKINDKWHEKFNQDMAEWKRQNNIEDGAQGLGEFPKRESGESPQDYAIRVADYETKADAWREAPSVFDYLRRANDEYREAYKAWKERYGIREEESVDVGLYEGDPQRMPHIVDYDDFEADTRAEADLAEAVGVDMSSEGARRHTKLSIIERRKNLESANAEDAIWIHDLCKKIAAEAERQGVSAKELRENLADIIEYTYFEEVVRDEDGNFITIEDVSDQMPIKETPGLEAILADIKDWYDEFFHVIEDAGLRNDAGYIEEGYVNHVWSKEKSDPEAYKKYVENFQRTKSPNMRQRIIETYREGRELGLVPKYKDIADILAHYSVSNNEAVANKKFLDDLSFIVVEQLNSDGEVVSIQPLLNSGKPNIAVADMYALYRVPGVGDVYVLKDIQRQFANIFGTMRTQDIPDWLSKTGKVYDTVSSTAKKIELSFSAFHMHALTEVAMAQMRPDRALKALVQYIIIDCAKAGTIPAYAHPEDFKFAASHLVQLGATQDYSAADVNNVTEKLREIVRELADSAGVVKKGAGYAATPIAAALDYINKGMDKVLWNYLHDGLKIACFKMFAEQIDKRVVKENLTTEQREQLLDEAGQYVNDSFGGQFFELLDISPALIKWLRRGFLSPDWLISTQRHFLANFGFGSLYSESGFLNYLRYNADNIKRAFGADIPRNENRRFRSKNAKQCYLLGVCCFYYIMMNAINAFFRAQDEEKEKEKADEARKTNPDYRSPYELSYPDGMKWYDYTMYGNTLGQQTHLFLGRYDDGTEWYARWGKQFREFPELFMGRHGVEFPTPLMERMSGKANPIGRYLLYDIPLTVGMYGYKQPRETQEIAEKYGNTVALLAMTAKKFVPYSVPTQQDKEFKMFDLVMPSQKGFSRWKAVDYFKTYIEAADMDGVMRTYNAAVMNGIDAEACLKAAISTIKATQRKELSDGIVDLQTAMEHFDAAKGSDERKKMKRKVIQYLAEQNYNAFTRDEAMDQVNQFINGAPESDNDVNKYVELQTSEDVRDEYRLNMIRKQAKKFVDEVKTAEGDRQRKLSKTYEPWLQIDHVIKNANSRINKLKRQLGKADDTEIMQQIRDIRTKAQEEVDKIQAP